MKNVKAGHMGKDFEILVQTREPKRLEEMAPEIKAIIKAYEDIMRSLFDIHEDDRIIYAPYGTFKKMKGIKGFSLGPVAGMEIQLHKCCGIGEQELRMLNKISKFDTGEQPVTDVSIEACDMKKHQKFSKALGETFTCTKITIDVDFTKWK